MADRYGWKWWEVIWYVVVTTLLLLIGTVMVLVGWLTRPFRFRGSAEKQDWQKGAHDASI